MRMIGLLIAGLLSSLPMFGQSWEQTKREDPHGGKTFYQFVLRGRYVTAPAHPELEPPRLVVFCGAGRAVRGQFLPGAMARPWGTSVVRDAHRAQVNVHLDDVRTTQELWESRSMALFLDRAQVKNLLIHEPKDSMTKRAILGIVEVLGNEVVVQFDLPPGTSTVIETCNIS
jgi:hypothetical protein